MCVKIRLLKNAELGHGPELVGWEGRLTPKVATDLIWRGIAELVPDPGNNKNEFNVLKQIQQTVKNNIKQNKKVKDNGNN